MEGAPPGLCVHGVISALGHRGLILGHSSLSSGLCLNVVDSAGSTVVLTFCP